MAPGSSRADARRFMLGGSVQVPTNELADRVGPTCVKPQQRRQVNRHLGPGPTGPAPDWFEELGFG
jgi:hypothetical protein